MCICFFAQTHKSQICVCKNIKPNCISVKFIDAIKMRSLRVVSCTLLLSILLTQVPTAEQISIYCVLTITNETSQCTSNAVQNSTLESLVINGAFNNSNSAFVFVEGVHDLGLFLSVNNVIGLSLQGISKNTTVKCKNMWNTSISFKNTSQLLIGNLTFLNCLSGMLIPGRSNSENVLILSGITFQGGQNLIMTDVQFVNGAFFVNNTVGQILVSNVRVISSLYQKLSLWENESIGGSYFNFSTCDDEVELVMSDTSYCFSNSEEVSVPYNQTSVEGTRVEGVQAVTLILCCTNVEVNLIRSNFSGFKGRGNGAGMALTLQNITHVYNNSIVVQHCLFEEGFAKSGGGVFIFLVQALQDQSSNYANGTEHNLISFYDSNFTNNSANYSGAAVQIMMRESYSSLHSVINISFTRCNFHRNKVSLVGHGGIAFNVFKYLSLKYKHITSPQYKTTVTNSSFQFNYVHDNTECGGNNGVISIVQTQFFMLMDTDISFNNCTAVLAVGSNLLLAGSVIVSNNNGYSGGGFLFCDESAMFLMPYAQILIANNSVANAGGGICVDSLCLQNKPMCFFQLGYEVYKNTSLMKTITVELVNNHADYAGHNIFGGFVDRCFMLQTPETDRAIAWRKKVFKQIFRVNQTLPSSITSIPLKICFCLENGTNDCKISSYNYSGHIFPGQQVNVSVVTVGQRNGLVPGSVNATTTHGVIPASQTIQKIPHTKCSTLTYTMNSHSAYEVINVTVHYEGDVSAFLRYDLLPVRQIHVNIKDCPIGFQINQSKNICDCIQIKTVELSCYIRNMTIIMKSDGWIGYGMDPYHHVNQSYIVHSRVCPFDYCYKQATINASREPFDQDAQCRFNRTGILCGSCSVNLSVILGTSDCWQCSNVSYTFLLFFALAGVLLIVFLTLCNFTVSEGTIGGLIFYANVVQTGATKFFPADGVWIGNVLRIFISWVSLDFGIPACLYDGMGDISKAWLQFVFPLYLWILSSLMVFLSSRYISVTRLLGGNSVKVLSTVIILSFTKLFRAVTVAVSSVLITVDLNVTNSDENTRRMWLKDPNILFLQGKHIPLFVVGILFGVACSLFLLYLLCIQCLQRFHCVQRFKPFTDCYNGPNTSRARFWTGLLLLSRVILVVAESIHDSDLYVTCTIGVAVSLLFVAQSISGGVYSKHKNNIIESFFLLNIVCLCLGTIAAKEYQSGFHTTLVSCGATFIVFLGLLLYHFWRQVRDTKFGVAVITLIEKIKPLSKRLEETNVNAIQPVVNYAEDREPLLSTLHQ